MLIATICQRELAANMEGRLGWCKQGWLNQHQEPENEHSNGKI